MLLLHAGLYLEHQIPLGRESPTQRRAGAPLSCRQSLSLRQLLQNSRCSAGCRGSFTWLGTQYMSRYPRLTDPHPPIGMGEGAMQALPSFPLAHEWGEGWGEGNHELKSVSSNRSELEGGIKMKRI